MQQTSRPGGSIRWRRSVQAVEGQGPVGGPAAGAKADFRARHAGGDYL